MKRLEKDSVVRAREMEGAELTKNTSPDITESPYCLVYIIDERSGVELWRADSPTREKIYLFLLIEGEIEGVLMMKGERDN
jgi:hypothetical protein